MFHSPFKEISYFADCSAARSVSCSASYLYGPAQVDASFDGHIVGGLEEGSLQEQGEEEQHGQHIGVLQKLFGGDEINPEQGHLEAEWRRGNHHGYVAQGQGQPDRLTSALCSVTLVQFWD